MNFIECIFFFLLLYPHHIWQIFSSITFWMLRLLFEGVASVSVHQDDKKFSVVAAEITQALFVAAQSADAAAATNILLTKLPELAAVADTLTALMQVWWPRLQSTSGLLRLNNKCESAEECDKEVGASSCIYAVTSRNLASEVGQDVATVFGVQRTFALL